jgi:hypothetical protein
VAVVAVAVAVAVAAVVVGMVVVREWNEVTDCMRRWLAGWLAD